jgi:uncharacterized protein (TIGR03435 family)
MIFAAGIAGAQTFEVASIKPSEPSAQGSSVGIAPGGIFRGRNITVKSLIRQAYDVHDFQISGGPGWIGTLGYDIEAKGNGPAVSEEDLMRMTEAQRNEFRAQMQARVRAMLADRFQLKLHKETKDAPVYALTVAKGGAKIQVSGVAIGPQSGFSTRRNAQGKSVMTSSQQNIGVLALVLSDMVGRPVLDKTGLAGNFDFKMTFAQDLADPEGPSVFTALEEQLGLKLESQRGPVEVMVIDSVEKASGN